MNIFITNAHNKLSQRIGNHLLENHNIKFIEDASKKNSFTELKGIKFTSLDASIKTNQILKDIDLVIYQGFIENNISPSDLNSHIQKTYNLLSAAIETGISKFILLSSLELIKSYDDTNTVTETWKSTPKTDISLLSAHLTEIIFKEFARTFPINISLLRLGYPIKYNNSDEANKFNSSVKINEIFLSLERIISLKNYKKWEIYHLQSDLKTKKFLTNKTNSILGVPIDNRKPINEPFYNPKPGVSKI
ncbi:MAG: hypothetical protein CL764_06300 [Chloroflexi bacterium]|nr:hypothetical protein [Chloroflexota bacterium]|tara:strand:+ start:1477 stop:2220 length:744 start_codon:yes stop_codon:yes gene_type:complete